MNNKPTNSMKTIILMASAVLMFTACKQEELDRANHQKDSLMTALQQRDNDIKERETSLNDFISSFNEVERNLDSVSARQQIIYVNSDKSRGDFRASQKDRINMQIKAI